MDVRMFLLGFLPLLYVNTSGYGQTQGQKMFLEGRDLLQKVTSFECNGEYLPGTSSPRASWKVRMVFKGGAHRTEMTFDDTKGGMTTFTRTFDGRNYQTATKSDLENALSTGIMPPESHLYQVPSPFDLAYGWKKQPFSQFKADPKLWATAEQMVDDGDETIHGIRCLKVNVHRESDGITTSKWLSYEHRGMPVKSLTFNSSGTVLKQVDVTEHLTVDVEGASLLIPLHIKGWLTHPYELKVDPGSVRVNQPIPDSEFEIHTAGTEAVYDRDTGVHTNLVSGRVIDRNMNQIVSVPTPPVAPVPEKPVRVWLIALNTFVAAGLGVFLLRNRLWARKNLE